MQRLQVQVQFTIFQTALLIFAPIFVIILVGIQIRVFDFPSNHNVFAATFNSVQIIVGILCVFLFGSTFFYSGCKTADVKSFKFIDSPFLFKKQMFLNLNYAY